MASGYNKVLLIGNMTRDIELRFTQSNQAVANFGLAISRKFKGSDGQVKEDTVFVDCEAWGKTAEMMKQFFGKGRPVFVEGRLKLDTWQDKTDGSNRSKLKVVVENFHFVDSKPGTGGGGHSGGDEGGSSRGAPARSSAAAPAGYEPIQEDDIPF